VEVAAILLARVLAFFETADVTVRKGIFIPELSKALAQHCTFQKSPKTLEEWNTADGALFEMGKLGNTVLKKVILYNNGIQVDTVAGTTESKRVLEELLYWVRDEFGITYGPDTVREWGYVSDVTFHTRVPILMTGPIERLTRGINAEISKILPQETIYQPAGISIGHDPLLRKYARAPFTIHRRAEVAWTENKYFSEAPLPTDIHLELLAQYERDVAQMLNVR
jgi:hypothetical protein